MTKRNGPFLYVYEGCTTEGVIVQTSDIEGTSEGILGIYFMRSI